MKLENVVKMYSQHSYNTKRNAQINLDGRTHWADDDTLAFFGCRISSAYDDASGQLFTVRYSQYTGFDRVGREHGFIIFDLWGNCVVNMKFSTAKKRDKEFSVTLKQCVLLADLVTETGRQSQIARLKRELEYLEGVTE